MNLLSNRIEISGGDQYKASSSKSLVITIQNVPGPQVTKATHPILIQTYDDYNKVVLDTTYAPLSYPLSFDLPLKGEEITVNIGKEIYIIKGTCSDLILVKASRGPMRVYLQLTGNMPKIPGARLHPSNVLSWPISSSKLEFRLSVP